MKTTRTNTQCCTSTLSRCMKIYYSYVNAKAFSARKSTKARCSHNSCDRMFSRFRCVFQRLSPVRKRFDGQALPLSLEESNKWVPTTVIVTSECPLQTLRILYSNSALAVWFEVVYYQTKSDSTLVVLTRIKGGMQFLYLSKWDCLALKSSMQHSRIMGWGFYSMKEFNKVVTEIRTNVFDCGRLNQTGSVFWTKRWHPLIPSRSKLQSIA